MQIKKYSAKDFYYKKTQKRKDAENPSIRQRLSILSEEGRTKNPIVSEEQRVKNEESNSLYIMILHSSFFTLHFFLLSLQVFVNLINIVEQFFPAQILF